MTKTCATRAAFWQPTARTAAGLNPATVYRIEAAVQRECCPGLISPCPHAALDFHLVTRWTTDPGSAESATIEHFVFVTNRENALYGTHAVTNATRCYAIYGHRLHDK